MDALNGVGEVQGECGYHYGKAHAGICQSSGGVVSYIYIIPSNDLSI